MTNKQIIARLEKAQLQIAGIKSGHLNQIVSLRLVGVLCDIGKIKAQLQPK